MIQQKKLVRTYWHHIEEQFTKRNEFIESKKAKTKNKTVDLRLMLN